jgi:hypothetical protein
MKKSGGSSIARPFNNASSMCGVKTTDAWFALLLEVVPETWTR